MKTGESSEQTVLEARKVSRALLYRWKKRYEQLGLEGLEEQEKMPKNRSKPFWRRKTEKIGVQFRKKYSFFGKNKRAIMHTRSIGKVISVSTIGRILRKLLRENCIKPAVFHVMGKVPKNPASLPVMHNDRSILWVP